MEEYDYLQTLSSEELINIIKEMLDFEEVTQALMILEDRDVKKVVELGCEIIRENKGDDYLQATVWVISFQDDSMKLIEALEKREAEVGKVLLNDIIEFLIIKKIKIKRELLNKLNDRYIYLKNNNETLECDYAEFCQMYLK